MRVCRYHTRAVHILISIRSGKRTFTRLLQACHVLNIMKKNKNKIVRTYRYLVYSRRSTVVNIKVCQLTHNCSCNSNLIMGILFLYSCSLVLKTRTIIGTQDNIYISIVLCEHNIYFVLQYIYL